MRAGKAVEVEEAELHQGEMWMSDGLTRAETEPMSTGIRPTRGAVEMFQGFS